MGFEAQVIEVLGGIDPLIVMLAIAALPFGECRVSIVYGVMKGVNPMVVFFGSVLANILVIPVIFFFLEQAKVMKLVNFILGKRITKTIDENRKKFEVYEELALFGFVAVPMVGTGAWTGTLLASVLRLDKKKSFVVISLGVLTAALIISFLSFGASGIFAFLTS